MEKMRMKDYFPYSLYLIFYHISNIPKIIGSDTVISPFDAFAVLALSLLYSYRNKVTNFLSIWVVLCNNILLAITDFLFITIEYKNIKKLTFILKKILT